MEETNQPYYITNVKDETYYFHQTPESLCKELVKHIPDLKENDLVFEPFSGEGNWVRAFKENQNIITTEIMQGTDYRSINLDEAKVDWVITNPPFRLENGKGKRVNSFYYLCDYFAGKTNKGFAFLANEICLGTLTPPRLKDLYEKKGVYMYKIVVCSIKKWRGRYFFIIFKNRCCNACKFKKEGCCPKMSEEDKKILEESMKEAEHHHHHHHGVKERFDFFDFVEGNWE